MNCVMIIPTGIGCEIGGHAGDANPVAKLIGKCCDKLILHPNVVNASDINEMPENAIYVEGSTLDRFLRDEIHLKEVFYNKILVVVNVIDANNINAINAAKKTIGANIELVQLKTPLVMEGFYNFITGKADGKVEGWLELCKQIQDYDFDVLGIQSYIEISEKVKNEYLTNGGINPWGGVEAIASKLISDKLDKITAHAPYLSNDQLIDFSKQYNELITDPRMAAEMVSNCFIHCILKGLHKAPKISYSRGLSVNDIDFLITPINCVGEPHYACIDAGIPIIAVKENKNILNDNMPDDFIIVDNYVEAAGYLMAIKAGVTTNSVRR